MQQSSFMDAGASLVRSPGLYRLVITMLIGLLVLLSVKISWLLLARFQPVPASSGLVDIVSEDVDKLPRFSGLGLFPVPVTSTPVMTGVPETRLPLSVQGLLLAPQQQLNQVAMAVQGKPGVYLAGDRLPLSGQVLVLAVESDRILLRHNGRKEKLTLNNDLLAQSAVASVDASGTAAGRLPGARAERSRVLYLAESAFAHAVPDYRQKMLKDPLFLSRYIRLSPRRENGQLLGYRLAAGRDSALYNALKLQPEDVLVSLDQQPVSHPGRVLALLPKLSQASQLTLGLLRAGQPVTYTLYL